MVSPGMWVLGLFSAQVGRPHLVWSWEMKGLVTEAVLAQDLQAVLGMAVLEGVVLGMAVVGMVVAQ